MDTLKPQSSGTLQQYGDWYTGRYGSAVIWYSEGPERAAAPPSPLITVPSHQSINQSEED